MRNEEASRAKPKARSAKPDERNERFEDRLTRMEADMQKRLDEILRATQAANTVTEALAQPRMMNSGRPNDQKGSSGQSGRNRPSVSNLAGERPPNMATDEGTFLLDTDASDTGLGAVLSQMQDGNEVVIAYASRTLSRPERNYDVTKRELLAIVNGLKTFKQYLLGRHFVVRTDHAALQWLRKTPEPMGQQARWLTFIEQFNFEIQHRIGTKHGNADSLS